jgi:hypothetical protein
MALYKRFERRQITTWGCDIQDCPWEMDAPTISGSDTAPVEVQREYAKHKCPEKPGEVKW